MDKKIAKLYDAGKADRAIHLLVQKIDQNPHKVENYLQLSTYLIEQGSSDQAQQLLEKALGLVKKPEDLYYDLAVCYYMQGNFEKSAALLNKIKNDDLTLYQKALVYLKLGQNQKALAYALSIKQLDSKVFELMGDIWLSLGSFKEAEETFLKIPEDKRSAKIYFLLGVTTFSSKREMAKQYFTKSKLLDKKYYEKAKSQYNDLLKLISNKGK